MVATIRASTADGVSLVVSVAGSGPPLLLIPGLGATHAVFDPLLPGLTAHHTVIVYDQRGIGDSELGTAAITMEVLARDAGAVLDAAGHATADVLGASLGGVVAQMLVVEHPARVRRLMLAATAPGGAHAIPADPRVTAALLGKGARTPADAYRMACTVLYSPQFQRAHPEFIEEQVRLRASRPVRARVFTAQLAAMRSERSVWDKLPEVAAPTLVMHGTADAVTPFENAQLLARRIPNAATRWFQDCGHLFFHERPDETARVIREFLR
jgi:pimeloyl-ACP methyl ester carboxylesterase